MLPFKFTVTLRHTFFLSHQTSLSLFGDLFKNEEPISLPKFFQKYRRKYRRILHSNSKLPQKLIQKDCSNFSIKTAQVLNSKERQLIFSKYNVPVLSTC